jgi:hypothetical protein
MTGVNVTDMCTVAAIIRVTVTAAAPDSGVRVVTTGRPLADSEPPRQPGRHSGGRGDDSESRSDLRPPWGVWEGRYGPGSEA